MSDGHSWTFARVWATMADVLQTRGRSRTWRGVRRKARRERVKRRVTGVQQARVGLAGTNAGRETFQVVKYGSGDRWPGQREGSRKPVRRKRGRGSRTGREKAKRRSGCNRLSSCTLPNPRFIFGHSRVTLDVTHAPPARRALCLSVPWCPVHLTASGLSALVWASLLAVVSSSSSLQLTKMPPTPPIVYFLCRVYAIGTPLERAAL